MSNEISVFRHLDSDTILPTELARGPWSPEYAHGGAPAGLVAALVEQAWSEPSWMIARLSLDFLRPFPLRPLSVTMTHEAKSSSIHCLMTFSEGHTEVLRAHVLSLRREHLTIANPEEPMPTDPATLPKLVIEEMPSHQDTFYYTAMDARSEPKPGHRGWFALQYPLLDGEPPTPAVRAAAAADFASGISFPLPFNQYLFPNVDLTIHLYREPDGRYVGVDANTWVGPNGVGLTRSTLRDRRGPVGAGIQTLRVRTR